MLHAIGAHLKKKEMQIVRTHWTIPLYAREGAQNHSSPRFFLEAGSSNNWLGLEYALPCTVSILIQGKPILADGDTLVFPLWVICNGLNYAKSQKKDGLHNKANTILIIMGGGCCTQLVQGGRCRTQLVHT